VILWSLAGSPGTVFKNNEPHSMGVGGLGKNLYSRKKAAV